jgi:uncharacterized protein YdcH (DUF465 family)
VNNETEIDAALLHHELVVAALQSHARLAKIEDEYQARITAYWSEVQTHIDRGVKLRTERHDNEVSELKTTIRELRDEIIRLTVRLLRAKKKPALRAKKRPAKRSK